MTLTSRSQLAAISIAFALAGQASAASDLAISQAYGGGGNSGATFTHDFVEIFNRGAAPVSLNGKSVQYGSTTGNFSNVTTLPNVTLQPGQYFLLQLASGANGAPLPVTGDHTGTLNLAGAAGKVALVNGTAALACGATATPCGAASLDLIVDLLGFGTAANLSETTPTANLSNTTAAVRAGSGCTDTDNNGADFTVATPAPRNTTTALNPCGGGGGPTDPQGVGAASPSSLGAGDATLLTVTVTGGSNPTSTDVVVEADLAAIGGAADQALLDDGTQGDATAGDGIFSFATTVAGGTGAGVKALPFTVTDAQARTDIGSIALSVVARVSVHDIQGAGRQSPLVDAQVVTEGIVTATKFNGFFLQTAPGEEDADPATSEGVFVFTSSAPPAAATVGNRVAVAGKVIEYTPSANRNQLSLTEISAPVVSVLSTGNALPAPIEITTLHADPTRAVDALERFEGMRVSIASLITTSGDSGRIVESAATSTATGDFHGVLPGVARPFREPGIGALDVTPIPSGVSPPRFDTNPERIRVDSAAQTGAVPIAVDARTNVMGLVGVLDYGDSTYTLLPDPGLSIVTTGGMLSRDVSTPLADEVTIGGFNLLRFYDDVNDAGGDVALTPEAFTRRLAKTARAICVMIDAPDILGVVEVENLNALEHLAAAINDAVIGGCATDPQYVPYLVEGNDVGKINIGYLVSTRQVAPGVPRVEVLEVAQFGKTDVDTNPNGSTSVLNDRPPLLLRARIHRDASNHFPVTVIANHLRSLNGVNSTDPGSNGWSTDGARIRAKRASQARYLANLVQARQAADPTENLVLVGDFNAFEYSDGYVDVMGIVTGREAPESEVLNYVDSPVVAPLTNMTFSRPADDRYSYVFEGNAQTLDHIVVNQALLDASPGLRIEHARMNADFGGDNFGDDNVVLRVSDHDPVVLYIPVDGFGTADLEAFTEGTSEVTAGQPVEWNVGVMNHGPNTARNVVMDIRVTAELPGLVLTPPAGATCSPVVVANGESTARCQLPDMVSIPHTSPELVRIGLRTTTLPTQVGATLQVIAEVVGSTPDGQPQNNIAWIVTGLTPPQANLVLYAQASPSGLAVGPDTTLSYRVKNFGRDSAESPRLVFNLVALDTKVVPAVPAGWSCAVTASDKVSQRWTCDFAGAFAVDREDLLRFDLNSKRSTPAVASAVLSSVTPDPYTLGGQNAQAIFVVLVRRNR